MNSSSSDDSDYVLNDASSDDGDDDSAVSWDRIDDGSGNDVISMDDESESASEASDCAGGIGMMHKTTLHRLIDDNQFERALGHLKKHPSDAQVQDREGWTPLHIMVYGDVRIEKHERDDPSNSLFGQCFRELLRVFPDAAITCDHMKDTPLHTLIVRDPERLEPWVSFGFFEYLVQSNATAASMESMDSTLPLHLICSVSRNLEITGDRDDDEELMANVTFTLKKVVKILLDAYPQAVSEPDSNGMMCLHHLCRQGASVVDVDICKRILLAYPEAAACEDDFGRHPLSHYLGHLFDVKDEPGVWSTEMLKPLLEAYPMAVNKKNYNMVSPIEDFWTQYETEDPYFVPRDDEAWEDIGWVLKAAVICETTSTSQPAAGTLTPRLESLVEANWSMAHAAAMVGCPRCWLRRMVEVFPEHFLEPNADGNLPLMIASGSRSVNEYLLLDYDDEESTHLQLILNAYPVGARISDAEGRLPLHVAIESGKVWDEGIKDLMQAAPQSLITRDIRTHFYPFLLAAVAASWDQDDAAASVSTCFELLRASPQVIGYYV